MELLARFELATVSHGTWVPWEPSDLILTKCRHSFAMPFGGFCSKRIETKYVLSSCFVRGFFFNIH